MLASERELALPYLLLGVVDPAARDPQVQQPVIVAKPLAPQPQDVLGVDRSVPLANELPASGALEGP